MSDRNYPVPAEGAPREMGRKPKLTPQEAIKRRDQGETVREIARSYSVHNSTISRLVA
jgi:Helix-turn-helix domain of resolvase